MNALTHSFEPDRDLPIGPRWLVPATVPARPRRDDQHEPRWLVPASALQQAKLDDGPAAVEIDLRAVRTALWRNRGLIAAVFALVLLAGIASVLLKAPIYRAEASVQIDAQSAKVLSTDDLEPLVAGSETERFIRTQMDVVRSRTLATAVGRTLNLTADRGFVADDGGDRRRAVVDRLQERLEVEMLPNSRVVRITFDDADPARAARIANAFAEELIRSNLQRRYGTSAYSRQFLSGQLADAKRRLEDAERATIAYARSARLIDASAGATRDQDVGTKSLTTANLVELNDAYATARAARIQAQQRWNGAQGAAAMTLPEVLSDPNIQALVARRAELRVQYEEERQRHKEDHPAVQQLDARARELDVQIARQVAAVRGSIRERYQVAERQEQALSGDVASLKQATLAEQDRGIRYNILRREVDTSREMYDGLLQRYKEVSAAAGIASNNITFIDRADAPDRPVSPDAPVNLAIALLVALSLSLLMVFGRERFVDRVRDPEDVGRKLGLPVLGAVPVLLKGRTVATALDDPRSGFSEAHNSICTSLDFTSTAGMPRSIMLTSTRPAEGKSVTAMSLAISLSRQHKRVVIVDADFRRPSLDTMFGLSKQVGLANLLNRSRTVAEVLQPTGFGDLQLIASGPTPPDPAALLSYEALAAVLDELADRFDVVVIDGPPVLGLADAPRLASVAAATVFVMASDATPARGARQALARLNGSHATIAGTVLTKHASEGDDYGTDYSYGYTELPSAAPPANAADDRLAAAA